jgi:hypothetical protein
MSGIIKDLETFTAKIDGCESITDYCEWCGMMYPRGSWDYYEIKIFGRYYHKICSDCKNNLKKVN